MPKVIIAVDLFGLPANYKEIERIAKKYNLLVLEDGAQGLGGNINGKKACSFGDAATTSFYPAKPLGCYGDGGAIFTNNSSLASLINSLKEHGKGENKYDNLRIGINSRLDTIQAVVLSIKLKAFIQHELEDVNRVYRQYNDRLKDVIEIPLIPEGYFSSFAQYTIKLQNKVQRDGLIKRFEERHIPCMTYYSKPLHKQEAFLYLNSEDDNFKITNELSHVVLSLPIHPYMKESEVETVSNVIKEFV